jgi:hypothetical protein
MTKTPKGFVKSGQSPVDQGVISSEDGSVSGEKEIFCAEPELLKPWPLRW